MWKGSLFWDDEPNSIAIRELSTLINIDTNLTVDGFANDRRRVVQEVTSRELGGFAVDCLVDGVEVVLDSLHPTLLAGIGRDVFSHHIPGMKDLVLGGHLVLRGCELDSEVLTSFGSLVTLRVDKFCAFDNKAIDFVGLEKWVFQFVFATWHC